VGATEMDGKKRNGKRGENKQRKEDR